MCILCYFHMTERAWTDFDASLHFDCIYRSRSTSLPPRFFSDHFMFHSPPEFASFSMFKFAFMCEYVSLATSNVTTSTFLWLEYRNTETHNASMTTSVSVQSRNALQIDLNHFLLILLRHSLFYFQFVFFSSFFCSSSSMVLLNSFQ